MFKLQAIVFKQVCTVHVEHQPSHARRMPFPLKDHDWVIDGPVGRFIDRPNGPIPVRQPAIPGSKRRRTPLDRRIPPTPAPEVRCWLI